MHMRILLTEKMWYGILALAASLRLAMAPFTGHPYDLGIWMTTGRYVAAGTSPYLAHPHIGYPPLWAIWCGVAYLASSFISRGNQFVYIFAIKIPIIIADFVLAIMILTISKNPPVSSTNTGRILATSFLLNPYVLIVGVIWGMMDNLVAILLILSIMLLTTRPTLSGVSASIAVALKLYPILFVPILLVFTLRTREPAHIAKWISAFLATSVVTILFPFALFRWDIAGFIGVGVSQLARDLGGIAPMATLQYFEKVGVTSVGSIPLQVFITASWLRLLWIPALILSVAFIIRKGRASEPILNMIRGCSLVYLTYLLTASWISEQLFELVLIFMLFFAAYGGLRKFSYLPYAVGSAIVLLFLTFNVPLTSFLFPIYAIDGAPLQEFGRMFLPWLTMIFGCYLVAEIAITAKALAQTN
jgi:hypothetical protein